MFERTLGEGVRVSGTTLWIRRKVPLVTLSNPTFPVPTPQSLSVVSVVPTILSPWLAAKPHKTVFECFPHFLHQQHKLSELTQHNKINFTYHTTTSDEKRWVVLVNLPSSLLDLRTGFHVFEESCLCLPFFCFS